MKETETITCKKCGQQHYMTPDGKGHFMPVFCCGNELRKALGEKTSTGKSKKLVKKKTP